MSNPTPKTPPLPSKGGSFTVDRRNKLTRTDTPKPTPKPAEAPNKDVTDA